MPRFDKTDQVNLNRKMYTITNQTLKQSQPKIELYEFNISIGQTETITDKLEMVTLFIMELFQVLANYQSEVDK